MPTAHFERCLALCVAMIPGVALGSPLYHLTDLGALAGFGSNYGTAVNNSGQVAGWSAGAIQQAMQAAGGVVTEIPTGGFSAAHGINNHGLVVGELGNAGVSSSPFAWDGTTLTQLATPTGTVVGGAFAVNDDGVAVGYTGTAPGKSEATVFGGGSYQILPRLAGAPVNGQDWAYGINSTGDIVGMDGGRAFLFSHGVMTPLAVQGSGSSGALAISNNGTAVGFAAGDLGVGNEFDHGVVWREGITTVIDLGVWSMFRVLPLM